MADITENLLGAVQIVVDEAIKKVKYDKTILCSIVSIDNDAGDEYTVSDGSMKFTAFGDSGYKIDTNVYVLIPNGDYNNKCLIVGRYVSSDTQSFSYVSPMDNFLQLTGNLYSGKEGELLANGEIQEDLLQSLNVPEGVSIGYDRLGISADFKTNLTQYNVISGSYGLHLDIGWEEKNSSSNTTQKHRSNIYLDTTDMWGNPYNYNTYFTQEKVFDISKISRLTDIKVYFYQNQDFINANNNTIPYKTTFDGEEVLFPNNLFVKDIVVSLGHSLDELTEDKVYLYTTDSTNYNQATSVDNAHTVGIISLPGDECKGNDKNVHLRWVHQVDNNKFKSIDEEDEVPANCHIHWYRYVLDKDITDAIAGMFWEEITPSNDKALNVIFTPDETNQEEQLKAVIVEIDEDTLAQITEDEYFEKDENYSDKKYNTLVAELETAQANLSTATQDKLKLDNQIQLGNTVEEKDYTELVTLIAKLKKEIEEAQEIIDNWDTNKSLAIREKAQVWYESEILTFLNTDTVANKATIDLVRGISIEALDAFNGIYKIYDPLTAYLTNQAEASKTRKLEVSFTSVLTGTAELDKAETVKWYIPKNNTMIQTPVDGIEFNSEDGDVLDDTNEKYYIIIRQFKGDLTELSTGKLVDRSAVQNYRIEKYFNENKNNNVIKCEVIRNNISFVAERELVFGLSGSNGRNATLILSIGNDYDSNGNLIEVNAPAWTVESTTIKEPITTTDPITYKETVKPATSSMLLKAQVYDYNNQPLTITKCVWGYVQPTAEADQPFKITDEIVNNAYQYRLELKDKNLFDDFSVIDNAEKFKGCVLACQVTAGGKIYSGYLTIPVRLNRLYKYLEGATSVIYNSQGASPSYYKDYYKIYNNIEQPFENIEVIRRDDWLTDAEKKWLPSVKLTEGNYYMLPNTLFVNNIGYGCVFAVKDTNKNQWVWKQPILVTQNRYTSPMLNEWDGSLTLDDENGTILSAMLAAGVKDSENRFSGVLVGNAKLADSGISQTGVYGYHQGVSSYGLKEDGTAFIGTAKSARLLFDGKSGTFSNCGYNGGTGIKMYLDGEANNSQYISLKNNGKEYVRLSTGTGTNDEDKETYFQINGFTSGNNPTWKNLLKIGNNDYFLQSANYNAGAQTGTRIDLQNGTLKGYNFNLSLKGNNGSINIDSTASTYPLQLGSNFKIDWNGNITASGGTIGGWNITESTLSAGNITLDKEGKISGGSDYTWSIGQNGTVTFNYIIANGGKIGPYKINSSSLSGGLISLNYDTITLGQASLTYVNNTKVGPAISITGKVYISDNLWAQNLYVEEKGHLYFGQVAGSAYLQGGQGINVSVGPTGSGDAGKVATDTYVRNKISDLETNLKTWVTNNFASKNHTHAGNTDPTFA